MIAATFATLHNCEQELLSGNYSPTQAGGKSSSTYRAPVLKSTTRQSFEEGLDRLAALAYNLRAAAKASSAWREVCRGVYPNTVFSRVVSATHG